MINSLRVVLTGGGSGGHVYPLLAVAEELARATAQEVVTLDLRYIGPRDRYDAEFAAAHVRTHSIPSAKWRRYGSVSNFSDIPRFFTGLIVALWRMFWIMPDVVFSKGGPGAFPVVFAGWFYRVPVLIHDSDAIPGVTNLLSARFAIRIGVSFARAASSFSAKKTALVGTPVRRALLENVPDQKSAKSALEFDPDSPLILVLGGSQGSERINQFIVTNLPALLEISEVLHQTGPENYRETESLSRAALSSLPPRVETRRRYHTVAFFSNDEMKTALAAADLVVSRAGSTAIAEIAAFGKPAVLIPLKESARDHQRANAYEFAKVGAASVIEEQNLLPGIFLRTVKSIMENPDTLAKMSDASKKFFMPDAAVSIAREILILAKAVNG